jgi:hypothetical protein
MPNKSLNPDASTARRLIWALGALQNPPSFKSMSIPTALTFSSVLHRLLGRYAVLRLQTAGRASGQRSSLRLALALVHRGVALEPLHTWLAMRLTLRSRRTASPPLSLGR